MIKPASPPDPDANQLGQQVIALRAALQSVGPGLLAGRTGASYRSSGPGEGEFLLALRGEEIPLGARIFAVADTLDAMCSDRPYRSALPFSAAREEIIRWSGRQFDPKVVETFLSMPEAIWENVRNDIDAQVYQFAQMQNAACTRN
jgi:hypothetical protein